MEYEEIGARVREARIRRVLTQEQLAELADITPVYVSQIERAVRRASLPVLIRLAEALGVEVGWLLAGDARSGGWLDAALNDCSESERRIILRVALAAKDALREEMPVA